MGDNPDFHAPPPVYASKGVKRPAYEPYSPQPSDEEEEEAPPDLHQWLTHHGYSLKEQITLCRAHASYCAAVLKPFQAKK